MSPWLGRDFWRLWKLDLPGGRRVELQLNSEPVNVLQNKVEPVLPSQHDLILEWVLIPPKQEKIAPCRKVSWLGSNQTRKFCPSQHFQQIKWKDSQTRIIRHPAFPGQILFGLLRWSNVGYDWTKRAREKVSNLIQPCLNHKDLGKWKQMSSSEPWFYGGTSTLSGPNAPTKWSTYLACRRLLQ
jgi:hypothetical protein